jgi:hypothetical protein
MKSKSNTFLFLAIICSFIIAAALTIFFTFFEIYKKNIIKNYSDSAMKNLYFAADKWLLEEGHQVKIIENGSINDLFDIPEHTALIFSSSFDWIECIKLYELIYNGLKVSIFIDDMGSDSLSALLEKFGIRYQIFNSFNNEISESNINNNEIDSSYKGADYDKDVYLKIISSNNKDNEKKIDWKIVKDNEGHIRILGAELNKGVLFVTGIPVFMNWNSLLDFNKNNNEKNSEINLLNARYTWMLSGDLDKEKAGIVIFRNKHANGYQTHDENTKSFWEQLIENKNIIALSICTIILILTGFWMTFPSFGKWKPERILPGKPIEQRFLTESHFFKKQKCLHIYLEPYAEIIRARYKQLGITDIDDISKRISSEYKIDLETVNKILNPANILNAKQLMHYHLTAKRILNEPVHTIIE